MGSGRATATSNALPNRSRDRIGLFPGLLAASVRQGSRDDMNFHGVVRKLQHDTGFQFVRVFQDVLIQSVDLNPAR